MNRVRLSITILVIYFLICAAGVHAAIVKTDLLGGLGEFEFSVHTAWQMMKTSTYWPTGVVPATPDDSVGAAWVRLTGYGVEPLQDTAYRIEPGKGLSNSHCQYFGLKGTTVESKSTYLQMAFFLPSNKAFKVQGGDELTFRLDKIFMSGYTVPSGGWARYRLIIITAAPSRPSTFNSVDLTPSKIPNSAEVTATMPVGVDSIFLRIEVSAGGVTSSVSPGIYVDGARLFRKSAGSVVYDTEQVPVPSNRAIKTHKNFYQAMLDDPYKIASNYDVVMLQYESEYPAALRLKYYHPDIKVLLYEAGGSVTDWRSQDLSDPLFSNSPLGFADVLAHHADWLYPLPAGFTPLFDNREPWLRDANYWFKQDYINEYPAVISNPVYQQEWREAVINKVIRYHLDGVFVDTADAMEGSPDFPVHREPSEVQAFAHGVYPQLHQAGIQVVMNDSIGILVESPGNIYFNPWWRPDRTYTPALGYESNNPDNTADTLHQEWAFFKHWPVNGVQMNHYNLDYWDATMSNMEAVAGWNKMLPTSRKKSVFICIIGADRPEDPERGFDGWAYFTLCSYMLAQNQSTFYTVTGVTGILEQDLTCTVRLGDPAGNRGLLTADKSLQMRYYKNGLVIVNGHPTELRNYRIRASVIDGSGKLYPTGLTVSLKPHTGRMFFYK